MPKNALIGFLLTLIASVAGATAQSSYRGFYAYCNPSQSGNAQTYCQTAAAVQWLDTAQTVHNNLLIAINWKDFETSDGVYVWGSAIGGGNRSLDTYITNAVALGMNISVGLIAGTETPDWVMDTAAYLQISPHNPGNLNCFSGSGSQSGSVVTVTAVNSGNYTGGVTGTIGVGTFLADSNQSAMAADTKVTSLGTGTGGTGTYNVNRSATTGAISIQNAIVVPQPWNTTFLSKYNAAMTEIANHMASVNGADVRSYVKIVKISGITNSSLELRLPGGTGGGTCAGANANQLWASAGYTPSRITTAFNSMLDNAVTAFTTAPYTSATVFSVAVIDIGALPSVDDNGQVYVPPPARTDETTRTILSQVLSNAAYSGNHFLFQWNALSNFIAAAQPSMSYYQSKVTGYNNDAVGFQANNRGGTNGGSDCHYDSVPITFTGSLLAGATSATLTSNANQINGNNTITFSDGTSRSVFFTGSTTAVYWASGIDGNVTASATVNPGFANCLYGFNTGSEAGDYEQIIDNAAGLEAVVFEYFGVDLTDLQGAIARIQAKSMALPN